MSVLTSKASALSLALAAAFLFASSAAADGTPTPSATSTSTPSPSATGSPAPSGTPWPAPTGIQLSSSVEVLNPDGSFIPPDQRFATISITWDLMPGFAGVYEVQRARTRRDTTAVKTFVQLNVVPAGTAAGGRLKQDDTIAFLELAGYEFCYRVRTVINGETGPFSNEVCTIAPPSTGPVPPAQTSIPGHPLQLVFGPQPAGTFSDAAPDLSGVPTVEGLENVRRVVPQALPASLHGYWVSQASLRGGPDKFGALAWFRGEGDRLLILWVRGRRRETS